MPRIGDSSQFIDRRRTARSLLFMASCACCAMASIAVAQVPVDANTAAVLPQPTKPSATAAPTPALTSSVQNTPVSAGTTTPSIGPSTLIVPPASESRSLGKPNSPLSARPSTDAKAGTQDAAIEGSSSGLLNSIDPRRNDFTRVLGALAAVVGLILLTRTLVVRYMPSVMGGKADRPSGVIEVLASYPIGRGQQLLVLKFARRILLVHQAGATSRTLTEMSDPDEVAATLTRLEAGASTKSAGKFKAALQSFETEHDAAQARRSRSGAELAATETEIIDLTRTHIRSIGRMANPTRKALR